MSSDQGAMQLRFDLTQAETRIPVVSAEVGQISRLNDRFFISFFQVDWQKVILDIEQTKQKAPHSIPDIDAKLSAVARVSVSVPDFKAFVLEAIRVGTESGFVKEEEVRAAIKVLKS